MAANIVLSRTWEAIHAHIGTELLRFLLIHCKVFVPLQSGRGMLQLCGEKNIKTSEPHPRGTTFLYNERYLAHAGFEPEHPLFRPNPLRDHHVIVRQMYDIPTDKRLPKRFRCMLKHIQYVLVKCNSVNFKALLFHKDDNVLRGLWVCLRRILPHAKANKWALLEWLRKCLANPREQPQLPWKTNGFLPRTLYRHYAELVGGWSTWLWETVVKPLVRNNWYATENKHGAFEYIRKPQWRQFQRQANVEQRIQLVEVATLHERAHRLRLMPGSGARIIQRCFKDESYRLKIVLKCMKRNWGASVMGFQDVFQKLVAFKRPGVSYSFIKFDVANAYDSINLDTLVGLVEKLFTHACYTVMRFRVDGKLITRVAPTGEEESNLSFPAHAIVTDCGWREFITRSELYDVVVHHIRHNLVQFRGKRFLQTKGIPQGSVLSGELCSLYYAHELDELTPNPQQEVLRMRWTDDTLIISESPGLSYPASPLFNASKCILDPVTSIRWCGLKISSNLQVSWDYDRYSTISRGDGRKFVYYARAKFGLRVLFSARLNSRATIIRNAEEAFCYLKRKVPIVSLKLLTTYFRHDSELFRMAVGTWGEKLLKHPNP